MSLVRSTEQPALIPAKRTVPVSVLVPVKNEARNLPRCLSHLQWADEIYVVDSGSNDATVEIAERHGAAVVQFEFNGTYPKKKNWSLENLPWRNEWVLIIDADEVVPPELAQEIAHVLADPQHDGYYLNFRYMFLGRWIKHCGYYPVWVLRLFKHRLGRYEKMPVRPGSNTGDNEAHEHVILDGTAGRLTHDVLHYPYPTIDTWVEKHNRYSNWEAELYDRFCEGSDEDARIGRSQRIKRRLKRIYLRLPLRFLVRFVYAYIIRRGFLDGRPGFILCVLLSFYDFLSTAKVYERRLQSGADGDCGAE
jgi:glycosyltransferase involved in cell wall biosynthesis